MPPIRGDYASPFVVGYQASSLNSGNYTMLIAPFQHVTADGKGLMLNGDITTSNPTMADNPLSADKIMVWNGVNSYTTFFHYEGWGTEYPAGWCWDNAELEFPYFEDTPGFENGIPEGIGMYFNAKTGTGKAMTFSGAVEGADEKEVPLNSGNYTMIGNPYPTALDLNDPDQFEEKNPTMADNPLSADKIMVWNGVNSYTTFFYYEGWGTEYPAGWCWDNAELEFPYVADTPGFENGIASGTGVYFNAKTGDGKKAIFKKNF